MKKTLPLSLNFRRRILAALCIAVACFAAYVFFLHDPLVNAQEHSQSRYEELHEKMRVMPSASTLQAELDRLNGEIARLRQVESRENTRSVDPLSQVALHQGLVGAYNLVKAPYPDVDLRTLQAEDLPESLHEKIRLFPGTLSFRFQGTLNAVYAFLVALQDLPGTPQAWNIETCQDAGGLPQINGRGEIVFNLWMGIQP